MRVGVASMRQVFTTSRQVATPVVRVAKGLGEKPGMRKGWPIDARSKEWLRGGAGGALIGAMCRKSWGSFDERVSPMFRSEERHEVIAEDCAVTLGCHYNG